MSDKRVRDLVAGDKLDLENDPIANGPCSAEHLTGEPCPDRDEDGKSITWQYELGIVEELQEESPGCIRVDFSNGSSIGFPPDHLVKVDDDVDGTPEHRWQVTTPRGSYLNDEEI